MAYDSARDVVVVFGGEAGAKDDTWEWDGAQWSMVDVAGPGGRSRLGLEYDAGNGVTLLFGGRNADGDALGDTWAWDGSTWEELEDVGPAGWGRSRHGMVYDSDRGVMVVFGGLRGGFLDDTLEWDGTEWTQVGAGSHGTDDVVPTRRIYLAMAYDAATQATILFGGFDGDPMEDDPIDDTWAYAVR
jgi:hypothetical protein